MRKGIALAALSVGLVLLAGCSNAGTPAEPTPSLTGGASSHLTPTTAPTTPAPTTAAPTVEPTPTSEAGVVAFGGSCDNVITPARVAELGFEPYVQPAQRQVETIQPGVAASVTSLGGLSCGWTPAGGDHAQMGAIVIPSDSLSDTVRAEYAEWFTGTCMGRGGGECDYVVESNGATVLLWGLGESADAIIGEVKAQAESFAPPRASPAPAGTWSELPSCDAVLGTVSQVTGVAGLEAGYPSDAVGFGPFPAALEDNGTYQWCPMYVTSGTAFVVTIQPNLAALDSEVTSASDVTPVKVLNADAAYMWSRASGGGSDTTTVVAEQGPNRLTVRILAPSGSIDAANLTAEILDTIR